MWLNPIAAKLDSINQSLNEELMFLDSLTDTDVQTKIEIENIKDTTQLVLETLNSDTVPFYALDETPYLIKDFKARSCVLVEEKDDLYVVHIVRLDGDLTYYKMFVEDSSSILPYYVVIKVGTSVEVSLVEITTTQDAEYRAVCQNLILDSVPAVVNFLCKRQVLH